MRFLRNAVAEILSLFVDDPWFVAMIVVWAAVIYVARHVLPRPAMGPLLFAGLATLLAGFTYRRARKKGT